MKVVVDTSVWIAAILSNRGASYKILEKVLDGELELAVSYTIYREFSEVVARPSIVSKAKLSAVEIRNLRRFLKKLKRKAVEKIKMCRDPNDDMFVNCAVSFGADYILSLDRDLLAIGHYKNIDFLSPSVFLQTVCKEVKK